MSIEDKKGLIKEAIMDIISVQIDNNENIDFFEFTIKNHEGNLQVESISKKRTKAY